MNEWATNIKESGDKYTDNIPFYKSKPVWELYGKKGLETRGRGFPRPGDAYQAGSISYHVRAGKHNLTPEDWTRYMDFADRVMGGKK